MCEVLFQKIISDWAMHVTKVQTMVKQASNEAIVDEEPSINPAPIGMGGMAGSEDDFTLAELLTMQDAINYSLALSGNHQLSAKLGRHIKGMGQGNGMAGSSGDMGGRAGSIGDMGGMGSADIASEFIREEIDEVCNAAAKLIQAWWCVKRSHQA